MESFTKESIIQAIDVIDKKPDVIKGRESKDYDLLLENGKRYPPILVLSEANKILGGDTLVVSDFNNSTRKPFKILRNLGFKIVTKNSVSSAPEDFDYIKFLEACNSADFQINDNLAIRFISSLITKPFVILTGLSGSGKTKLALAFAKWLTGENTSRYSTTFLQGEELKSSRVTYQVAATDSVAVTFIQRDSGTKSTLPYELINEWVKVIRENNFTLDTPTRKIRETVENVTKYSTQLNSFETQLKAAAFHLISKEQHYEEILSGSSVCLVPVGADWTNREPLLGYPNALEQNKYVSPENGALQLIVDALDNPWRPYFLILDEMNLSHVERYFADFLSGMESTEPIYLHSGKEKFNGIPPSFTLPNNVFIIGTVNIDETTYMFSPKVLDRANVIEFRVKDDEMKSFLSGNAVLNLNKLKGKGISMADDFLAKANQRYNGFDSENINDDLLQFFIELKNVGAEFGYRTAAEIKRFVKVAKEINKDWPQDQILDAAIMQKLLPKLHGSRRKLEVTLLSLAKLCLTDASLASDSISPKKEFDFNTNERIKYPISLEKIRRMNINLITNNFTSYAEA